MESLYDVWNYYFNYSTYNKNKNIIEIKTNDNILLFKAYQDPKNYSEYYCYKFNSNEWVFYQDNQSFKEILQIMMIDKNLLFQKASQNKT